MIMSTINLLGLQRPPKKMKDDSPLSLSSCKHRNSEARKILFERFSFRSQFPLVDGEKHAVEFLDSVRQKASEPQYKKTNNIPAKEIVQKTRHKNINSLNNYSAISDKKNNKSLPFDLDQTKPSQRTTTVDEMSASAVHPVYVFTNDGGHGGKFQQVS